MVDWGSFLPPFFGVLVAFVIDRAYGYIKDISEKRKVLRSLKNELEKGLDLLVGKGNVLPMAIWNSATSSGKLMLLSYDQITQISSVYFKIENQIYEAKRTRDIAEMYRTEGHPTARKVIKQHWQLLSRSLVEKEKNLRGSIEVLLRQEWWDC